MPGARLMASGIAQAKWNNADVTDAAVDVTAMRRWYESRGMPWGMRVPLEIALDFGEPLFVKRCVLPTHSSGAAFVHTNPETVEEDETLASHNPIEVPGFLIRLADA
jgi:hypothetical protein